MYESEQHSNTASHPYAISAWNSCSLLIHLSSVKGFLYFFLVSSFCLDEFWIGNAFFALCILNFSEDNGFTIPRCGFKPTFNFKDFVATNYVISCSLLFYKL